jgi:hypothetical protein
MVRKSFYIFLLFAGFFLTGISGVNASVSHDHHEEISGSPFNANNAKSSDPSLHCPLKKHNPNGHICPQSHARGYNKEARIMVDCGGNPNGAIPASLSFSKSHILFSVNSLLPDFKDTENIFVSSKFFQQLISDQIDHPPQS